jgi:uncharacterized protein (TIGR04255 family)
VNRDSLSSGLPQFAKPPVVEVAISVQFEELKRFKLIHFGLLWEHLRDRFPSTEHQPPLAPVVELFGVPPTRRLELRVEEAFPIGRCWYGSVDGNRLVQVQPDRFILNWRKLDAETQYPSYDHLRGEFERELGIFIDFVHASQLGEFEPTQCEVIYVNHLPAGDARAPRLELSSIVAAWSGNASGQYLPDIEDARLAWQYRFEEDGAPLGRLHVQLNTAVREPDSQFVVALQLTGRGDPGGSDLDSVLRFTDRAHEWIVNGFAEITTPGMHQLWERQR